MGIEPLLLWSLNAVSFDGSTVVDRPDRISCGVSGDSAPMGSLGNGVCLPEGFVVWLGRHVVPQQNESLADMCGRYKCTAGARVICSDDRSSPKFHALSQAPCCC